MLAGFVFLIANLPAFQAPATEADFVPMKIGSTWTYKIEGKNDRFIITANKAEKVGEQDCVVFEGKINGKLVASEHIALMKDGAYRFQYDRKALTPPICYFRANYGKGEAWNQVYTFDGSKILIKYKVDIEDVTVPAGKFKDAHIIRAEANETVGENVEVNKSSIWYVKGVGMVKQVVVTGDIRILIELEKFEEPKQ